VLSKSKDANLRAIPGKKEKNRNFFLEIAFSDMMFSDYMNKCSYDLT